METRTTGRSLSGHVVPSRPPCLPALPTCSKHDNPPKAARRGPPGDAKRRRQAAAAAAATSPSDFLDCAANPCPKLQPPPPPPAGSLRHWPGGSCPAALWGRRARRKASPPRAAVYRLVGAEGAALLRLLRPAASLSPKNPAASTLRCAALRPATARRLPSCWSECAGAARRCLPCCAPRLPAFRGAAVSRTARGRKQRPSPAPRLALLPGLPPPQKPPGLTAPRPAPLESPPGRTRPNSAEGQPLPFLHGSPRVSPRLALGLVVAGKSCWPGKETRPSESGMPSQPAAVAFTPEETRLRKAREASMQRRLGFTLLRVVCSGWQIRQFWQPQKKSPVISLASKWFFIF